MPSAVVIPLLSTVKPWSLPHTQLSCHIKKFDVCKYKCCIMVSDCLGLDDSGVEGRDNMNTK